MYILGICNDETASACLMKNGEIIFAASEERFSRKKLDNSFPQKSIESCLNFAKIELKDVDAIAYAWAKGFQEDLVEKYLILGEFHFKLITQTWRENIHSVVGLVPGSFRRI